MNTRKPAFHTPESLAAHMQEEGECVIWTGPFHKRVPHVHHDGKMVPVRRLIVQWNDVVLEPGEMVSCKCRNPRCVMDEHIRIRNPAEHAKVMAAVPRNEAARRARLAQVKRATTAKLTMEQVREIRASKTSSRELAEFYGVHRSLISRIRAGKAWQDFSSPFAGLGARP